MRQHGNFLATSIRYRKEYQNENSASSIGVSILSNRLLMKFYLTGLVATADRNLGRIARLTTQYTRDRHPT